MLRLGTVCFQGEQFFCGELVPVVWRTEYDAKQSTNHLPSLCRLERRLYAS